MIGTEIGFLGPRRNPASPNLIVIRLVPGREHESNNRSISALEERTWVIRRFSTGSVFRVVAAGAFFSLIPLALFFGVLAMFGLNTVKWNNQPIYGFSGLLVSPFIGVMLFAAFVLPRSVDSP